MATVHQLLRKYSIRPRKRLGQHFLAAGPTIDKIVTALDPDASDCVIEIGSGLGVMTRRIAERAGRVIAVEQDERMVDICRTELSDMDNVEILHRDILEFDLSEHASETRRVKVAGNLPYNISSPILFWIMENAPRVSSAVIMLQREVAERVAALHGGKDYGTISVMAQAQANVDLLFKVSAASFVPPPEVESAVLRIDFSKHLPLSDDTRRQLTRVVKAAFGKRRKTVRNALIGARSLSANAGTIDEALNRAGIEPGVRPEQIPVSGYLKLARLLG